MYVSTLGTQPLQYLQAKYIMDQDVVSSNLEEMYMCEGHYVQ